MEEGIFGKTSTFRHRSRSLSRCRACWQWRPSFILFSHVDLPSKFTNNVQGHITHLTTTSLPRGSEGKWSPSSSPLSWLRMHGFNQLPALQRRGFQANHLGALIPTAAIPPLWLTQCPRRKPAPPHPLLDSRKQISSPLFWPGWGSWRRRLTPCKPSRLRCLWTRRSCSMLLFAVWMLWKLSLFPLRRYHLQDPLTSLKYRNLGSYWPRWSYSLDFILAHSDPDLGSS